MEVERHRRGKGMEVGGMDPLVGYGTYIIT
jgi:hypothetical protein